MSVHRFYEPRDQSARAPRLISLHPLVRATLYVVLFYVSHSFALDTIWRIAQP